MNNQKGLTNITLIIIAVALLIVGVYFVSTSRYAMPPVEQACPQDAMQCPDGSYVSRTGHDCSFAACPTPSPTPSPTPKPTPTPTPRGERIIKRVGQQEGSYLIQKINPDGVEGLWSQAYPVAREPGTPLTLHIGDDIGYTCEGVSEKLTSINYTGQTVTFTKVVGPAPIGGCPICLAGGTRIDTPTGSVAVKDIQVGISIWTTDTVGHRVAGVVMRVSRVPVPPTHQMVHLVLSDGRALFASPGHPTTDGHHVGDLVQGEQYDGSVVISTQRVSYGEGATYDVLPSGDTGFYWANGVLLGSTLRSLLF